MWTVGAAVGFAVVAGLAWDRHRERVRTYWRTWG